MGRSVSGWPSEGCFALVYSKSELEDGDVLAGIKGILETSRRARETSRRARETAGQVPDPLRAVAQVNYIARDPETGRLALVFKGRAGTAGNQYMVNSYPDHPSRLWRHTSQVAEAVKAA